MNQRETFPDGLTKFETISHHCTFLVAAASFLIVLTLRYQDLVHLDEDFQWLFIVIGQFLWILEGEGGDTYRMTLVYHFQV